MTEIEKTETAIAAIVGEMKADANFFLGVHMGDNALSFGPNATVMESLCYAVARQLHKVKQ